MSRVAPARQTDLFASSAPPAPAPSSELTQAEARFLLDSLVNKRRLNTDAPWSTASEAMAEESEVRRLASMLGSEGRRLLSAHEAEVSRLYGLTP